MNQIGYLHNMLAASSAMITRAEMRIPGFRAPVPVQYDLRALRANQARLEKQLDLAVQREVNGLGSLALIGGAVLGVSAIGGWIYKHFTDAKRLETQTDIYQDLRAEGTDSERAAELVFGGGTDFSALMNKLIILSLIGAGVYLVVKLV